MEDLNNTLNRPDLIDVSRTPIADYLLLLGSCLTPTEVVT